MSFSTMVVIGEKIDIDRAWSPADFFLAVAAELLLRSCMPLQQRARRQVGCDREAHIDECRLVGALPQGGVR